jgi:drug/metabolite transporter (DMT)-like permease
MPIHLIFLVLFAAFLHASWNALLRSGADRLWSMTVMCIAIAITSVIVAAAIVPPAIVSWGYVVLSGVLHVGYNLFLVRSYRVGDLGQIYPISRGSSPVLITLGAAVFAGESITPSESLGVALVSVGIISLAFRRRSLSGPSLPYALGTGCFIAAYSVVDGIGVRLSGAPLAYTVWMCSLWGVLMSLVYIGIRNARSLFSVRPGTMTAVVGGLVSLLAYGMIIYAMNEAPLGAVSALRETSVLFAVLIGYVFLGETLTTRRILACVVIASGTLIIG